MSVVLRKGKKQCVRHRMREMRTRFIRVAWKDDVFAGCGRVSGELDTEVLASVVNTSWFVSDDPSATS